MSYDYIFISLCIAMFVINKRKKPQGLILFLHFFFGEFERTGLLKFGLTITQCDNSHKTRIFKTGKLFLWNFTFKLNEKIVLPWMLMTKPYFPDKLICLSLYSRLRITRTFRGNRKRFELSEVQVMKGKII